MFTTIQQSAFVSNNSNTKRVASGTLTIAFAVASIVSAVIMLIAGMRMWETATAVNHHWDGALYRSWEFWDNVLTGSGIAFGTLALGSIISLVIYLRATSKKSPPEGQLTNPLYSKYNRNAKRAAIVFLVAFVAAILLMTIANIEMLKTCGYAKGIPDRWWEDSPWRSEHLGIQWSTLAASITLTCIALAALWLYVRNRVKRNDLDQISSQPA